MGVFDDLIHIGENGELLFNQWIEWDHFLVPNKPEWFRELYRRGLRLAIPTTLSGIPFIAVGCYIPKEK